MLDSDDDNYDVEPFLFFSFSTWPDLLQLKRSSPDAKLNTCCLGAHKDLCVVNWITVTVACTYGHSVDKSEEGGSVTPLFIIKGCVIAFDNLTVIMALMYRTSS